MTISGIRPTSTPVLPTTPATGTESPRRPSAPAQASAPVLPKVFTTGFDDPSSRGHIDQPDAPSPDPGGGDTPPKVPGQDGPGSGQGIAPAQKPALQGFASNGDINPPNNHGHSDQPDAEPPDPGGGDVPKPPKIAEILARLGIHPGGGGGAGPGGIQR